MIRRRIAIESRTQLTNCLYSSFVISVSSIQKASTVAITPLSSCPKRADCVLAPIINEPFLMKIIPNGLASLKFPELPAPTSSPAGLLHATNANSSVANGRIFVSFIRINYKYLTLLYLLLRLGLSISNPYAKYSSCEP